jgi:hypothetical protein
MCVGTRSGQDDFAQDAIFASADSVACARRILLQSQTTDASFAGGRLLLKLLMQFCLVTLGLRTSEPRRILQRIYWRCTFALHYRTDM